MNKIQPLDQVSSIIANALNQATNVRKSYQKFFIETMILILTIYGKLNFLQLGRHGKSCESRYRQNFKKDFDWCRFNKGFCRTEPSKVPAIALDHSYLPKSGKKTPGLGYYWSGCAGTAKRGLEILGFAHIQSDANDARFLFAEQTLPKSTRGRIPYYLAHMKGKQDNQTARCLRAVHAHREDMLSLSNILVGDSLFASYNFITGAMALGFNVISRLRDDAVLQYLYTGPQKEGRGRKKEFDGQVDINNLSEGVFVESTCELDGEEYTVFSAVVKSKSLKRKIKVVVVEYNAGKGKRIRKILFSTDIEMKACEIFKLYHSRFQIEFLFRDGKQNTGLEDWQSTDTDRLEFGYNASLSAVNVAREFALQVKEQTGRQLSVASVKKMLHNASLYQYIRDFFECPNSGDPKIIHLSDGEIPANILFYGVRDSA